MPTGDIPDGTSARLIAERVRDPAMLRRLLAFVDLRAEEGGVEAGKPVGSEVHEAP